MTQPDGYTSVAPWIVTDDTAALLDFVTRAFGGEELLRVPLQDGTIGHAEIRIGDTILLAFDRKDGWPELPSLLRVWVPDADAATARAVELGGRVVTELSTGPFGQRGGRVRDPFGNIWWVDTHVEDVPHDVAMARLAEPEYAAQMRDAQETLDRELGGAARAASPPVIG